jgi:hypothetical protein
MKAIRLVLILAAAVAAAGCASDPRRSQGLTWVLEQQQERMRLEALGYPQYAHH